MGIRDCAMGCGAFRGLKRAYENREEAALRVKAAGGKVVGKLGCDVPDELLLAGGLFPVQVYADPERPLTVTDELLEYAFDPVVRAQFEKLTDGTYFKLLDALAVSNSPDVLIRIYLYLRELRRSEPERPVPETEFIDWLFTRNRLHQARNELTLRLFWETAERWAGRPITGTAERGPRFRLRGAGDHRLRLLHGAGGAYGPGERRGGGRGGLARDRSAEGLFHGQQPGGYLPL